MSEVKGNIGPGLGDGWAQGAGDAGLAAAGMCDSRLMLLLNS